MDQNSTFHFHWAKQGIAIEWTKFMAALAHVNSIFFNEKLYKKLNFYVNMETSFWKNTD